MFSEICYGDYFNPSCGSDEILLMQQAQYGRMRIGKCIEEDLGFLGCQVNILNHMDGFCSGKRQCNILITRQNIPTTEGCRKGLEKYLDASFECARGT